MELYQFSALVPGFLDPKGWRGPLSGQRRWPPNLRFRALRLDLGIIMNSRQSNLVSSVDQAETPEQSAPAVEALTAEVSALQAQLDLLQKKCDRFETLFRVSGDALSIIDLSTGRFVECNAAAVSLYGAGTPEKFLNLSPD